MGKGKNILVVNGSSDLYGANRILSETISILLADGHKVFVLLEEEGPFVAYLMERHLAAQIVFFKNLPNISRKMFNLQGLYASQRNYVRIKRFLRKFITSHHIDIAYINTLSCVISAVAVKRLGVRTFVHIHEIIDQPKIAAILINRLAIRYSDFIVSVSRAVTNNLLKFSPSSKECVYTVSNGIPDLDIDPDAGATTENKLLQITLIARIKPEKGIWFFLEAIDKLGPLSLKCQFNIIGGPAPNGEHYVDQLKLDIKRHSYNSQINYVPFTPDVLAFQQAADIIVVPSLMKDPFPTTVLEGMRVGKPVIATNNGGAAEAVVHGKSGYLIDPSNISELVSAIRALIENPNLRYEFGMEGRRRFLKNFCSDIFRDKFLDAVFSRG